MEIITSCPICLKEDFTHFLSCIDYTVSRETFSIVQCKSCEFRFTNPRPREEEIGKYYESEEYVSHSATKQGLINKAYGIVRNYTIKKKVNLINKQTICTQKTRRNVLDYGCGTGEFLNACRKAGWKVLGVEPSEVARKNTIKKYGIEPLSPAEVFYLNEKFNVITLWHVLEHIHPLKKTIGQFKKLLADSGVLVIAVPNCNSWDAKKYGKYWAAYDVPRHLYHFTKKDIQKLFSEQGFMLINTLPMKFDSYYVSLLSTKNILGKTQLFSGFLNGLLSNLNASRNYGHSSQIYIFKKET